MSELDTYFQPTGRQFGQAGSLQSDTMSAMDRRQAVTNMQNDQRRRLELARRVQRQLGQQSRRGNVRAGLLALDFMDREAAAGQPIPAGISSYESNRARGAQTIMDNEDQAAQMDEVTRGGSNPNAFGREPFYPGQTGTEPGYQPGTNAEAIALAQWRKAQQGMAEMDEVTRGGSNEPLIKNPFVGTDLEEPFNRLWDKPGTRYWNDATEDAVQYIPPQMRLPVSVAPDGSISSVDGRTTTVMPDGRRAVTTASGEYSQQESATGAGSLAQRVASAPVSAPSPSPLPAGQMDRSGSRNRVGVMGSGEGGMLTDSDKELLDAGRRVSGLRPAGFGSRPGGQFGIQVSSVASPVAAPATPTPSPVAPSTPAAPVTFDPATLPRSTQLKVEGMRGRQKMDSEILAKREAQYNSDMAALQREKQALAESDANRNAARTVEDMDMAVRQQEIAARTLADRAEQARKVEANKKSRITKRSDVKEAEGSIFAGNAYRPVNWTQEDEDASARDMRLATMLSPLSIFGFGKLAVNRMNRATGRALDPSKWNR